MVLKQGFWNHLRSGWLTIFLLVGYSCGYYYYTYIDNRYNDEVSILLNSDQYTKGIMLLFTFGLILIPGIYLHIEYTIRNWNNKVVLENDFILFKASKQNKKIHFEDLENVILYKAANADSFHMVPMQGYYYARLITKSGDNLLITCLMSRKLEQQLAKLPGIEIDRRKPIFATTFLSTA